MGVVECRRMSSISSSTFSTGVCDRLIRNTSTRRSSSPLRTSGDSDDGPSVHRIFVFIDVSLECFALTAKVGVAEQRPAPTDGVTQPPPSELAGDDRGHNEGSEEWSVDDAGVEGDGRE